MPLLQADVAERQAILDNIQSTAARIAGPGRARTAKCRPAALVPQAVVEDMDSEQVNSTARIRGKSYANTSSMLDEHTHI